MPGRVQAFYSDKKKQYDISKVPDIYDSAKYDAIHNAELGLNLEPLYHVRSASCRCCRCCRQSTHVRGCESLRSAVARLRSTTLQ